MGTNCPHVLGWPSPSARRLAYDICPSAASRRTITINDQGIRDQIVANLQWTSGILFMTVIMLYFMLCGRGFLLRRLLILTRTGRSRRMWCCRAT